MLDRKRTNPKTHVWSRLLSGFLSIIFGFPPPRVLSARPTVITTMSTPPMMVWSLCLYIHMKVPVSLYRPRTDRSSGEGSDSIKGDTTESSTSIKSILVFFFFILSLAVELPSTDVVVSVFYDQPAHRSTVGDAFPPLSYAVTGGRGRGRGWSEAVDLAALVTAMAPAATAAVWILGIRPHCRGSPPFLNHLRPRNKILWCSHDL